LANFALYPDQRADEEGDGQISKKNEVDFA